MKLKNIKAVLFDKDGTLMDFDSFWISVTKAVFEKILRDRNLDDSLLDDMLQGVGINGKCVSKNGLICKGTYEEINDVLFRIISKHDGNISSDSLYGEMMDAFNSFSRLGDVLPTCEGLKEALEGLKDDGIILGVVTTDNGTITKHCLDTLGISGLFECVYTADSGFRSKPAPDIAADFISCHGLEADSVLMVGDTETDILFAENSGIRSALIISDEESDLIKKADIAIRAISEIRDHLDRR